MAGLVITIAALGFVTLLLAVAELASRSGMLQPEVSRGFVHATVGAVAGLLPLWFVSPSPFYPVAGIALVLTGIDSSRGRLRSIHGVERRTYGTAVFAASFMLAAFLCWTLNPEHAYIFSAAMLVLAFADPMAAVVGRLRRLSVGSAEKTLLGSAAFFSVTVVIVAVILWIVNPVADGSIVSGVLIAALCGLAAATAEHATGRGHDNLAIVASVCTVLHLAVLPGMTSATLLIAVLVPAAFSVVSFQARLLDGRGSLVAALLAATILLMADWRWVIPGLLFFLTASSLSRIGRGRKRAFARRLSKGSVRDAAQVMANGGVPWIMIMAAAFMPAEYWYWGFAGAFAAAAADTWATETGMLSTAHPRDVRTWRSVLPGSSGAVSLLGTVSGLTGAILIAVSAAIFLPGPDRVAAAAILAAAGFAGSLVDTLLGASVQALFTDPSGVLTEIEDGNRLVRGWRWLNNDRVNWIAGLVGGLLAIAGSQIVAL